MSIYIAITNKNGWGKGATIQEAKSKARAESRIGAGLKYEFRKCEDEGAYIDGMGRLCAMRGTSIETVTEK